MEGRGAVSPGILTLTTGLSKPFMRIDKYPTLLKELERHMEVSVCAQTCVWMGCCCCVLITSAFSFLSGGLSRQARHSEVHGVFQKSVCKLNVPPVFSDVACNQTLYAMN